MEIDNTLDELKEAYQNYKKGEYIFGEYGVADQIKDAFHNGKIFVLTSSNKSFWVLLLLFILIYPFGIMIGTLWVDKEFFLDMLLTFVIFAISIGTLTLFLIILLKRNFVVIGPSGIYYRKIITTNCFQWNEITVAERGVQAIKTRIWYPGRVLGSIRVTTFVAVVNIILPDGDQIKFNSVRYKSTEFVDLVKREMFICLFLIYSELSDIEYRERFRTDKNTKY